MLSEVSGVNARWWVELLRVVIVEVEDDLLRIEVIGDTRRFSFLAIEGLPALSGVTEREVDSVFGVEGVEIEVNPLIAGRERVRGTTVRVECVSFVSTEELDDSLGAGDGVLEKSLCDLMNESRGGLGILRAELISSILKELRRPLNSYRQTK